MPTKAKTGYGTAFGIESATPGTFADLAEVTTISGLGLEREVIDATHLKSPDRYREKIPGLRNATDVSLTINYEPGGADEVALLAALNLDVTKNFKVTFNDGSTWVFAGFMTGFAIGDLTPEGKMEATVTFSQSGKPTQTGVA